MSRLLFGLLYRLGLTPWDGHALPARLREAAAREPKGRALDVGCGTGDASIFLARAGWDVTGVDFVERALAKARAKAAAAGARVRFLRGDATKLEDAGVGGGYRLLVDGGLLHGLSDAQRDAYVPALGAAAAPGATLVIAAFEPGARRNPRGIDPDEVVRRFAAEWELVDDARDEAVSNDEGHTIRVYELRRR